MRISLTDFQKYSLNSYFISLIKPPLYNIQGIQKIEIKNASQTQKLANYKNKEDLTKDFELTKNDDLTEVERFGTNDASAGLLLPHGIRSLNQRHIDILYNHDMFIVEYNLMLPMITSWSKRVMAVVRRE